MLDPIAELRGRNLVADETKGAADHFRSEPRVLYCGFDPTGPGLQLGNLVPIIALRRLQLLGHKPIVLIGGGTALIGDPSGKSAERPLTNPAEVAVRAEIIAQQAKSLLDFDEGPYAAALVNNHDWLSDMSAVQYVRDVCKLVSAKRIASMDAVKSRWERDEDGISLAEFAYVTFQAWDWVELRQRHGCTVQVGGRDQWGNITVGIELVRKQLDTKVFGLTFPLLVDAHGQKMGKSENGRIWLDPSLTSRFAMHQYFLQAGDEDAANWLPILTFLANDEIRDVLEAHRTAPERRYAQTALADNVTKYVHGHDAIIRCWEQQAILFGTDRSNPSVENLAQLSAEPGIGISVSSDVGLLEVLVKCNLVDSTGEARRLIAQGGITWNGNKLADTRITVSGLARLYGRYAIARRGRRSVRVLDIDCEGRPDSR